MKKYQKKLIKLLIKNKFNFNIEKNENDDYIFSMIFRNDFYEIDFNDLENIKKLYNDIKKDY